MTVTDDPSGTLRRTPLFDLHQEQGAKLVPFAGYSMPVNYGPGILAEHLHTRKAAGLFDISHMGQIRLTGPEAVPALETLCPAELAELGPGRMRYSFFTNEVGGILDDLMVTREAEGLFLIVNAARKDADLAHLSQHLPHIGIEPLFERALLALQGPAAASVLGRLAPGVAAMPFMTAMAVDLVGIPCFVSRSGYTGEDGYEISVPADGAEVLARRLLAEEEVAMIGLGARDSLRLEAGLCLYGHDIDETTTFAEAGLIWAIGARRRREGGFPGAQALTAEVSRRRVGILPEGRAPAREGTVIVAGDSPVGGPSQAPIGAVTSGGYGPTIGGPIAMGYVAAAQAAVGTEIGLILRGQTHKARIARLPFTSHRYYRG